VGRRTGVDWISKTDLLTYVRCPFAFWKLSQGVITRRDLFDARTQAVIDEGIAFHEQIDAGAERTELATLDAVDELLLTGTTVLNPPLIENAAMMIFGRPDAIVPADGAMLPVEYKSHRRRSRLDELELAFYWQVLSPLRTNQSAVPHGVLVLRDNGQPVPVAVEISERRFRELEQYLVSARDARRHGVQPRVCGCHVCSVVLHDEVQRSVVSGGHLSRINGVGARNVELLKAIDVTNLDDLAASHPLTLWFRLQDAGLPTFSVDLLNAWIQHAIAYRDCSARYFGAEFPVPDEFIVVDLEYLTEPVNFVWLAGYMVVSRTQERTVQIWADDDPAAEQALLVDLASGLDQLDPTLPLVTWGGASADAWALGNAASRHGVRDVFDTRTHIDLKRYAKSSVRLPVEWFRLKTLVGYFALGTHDGQMDGFTAALMYQAAQATRDKNKRRRCRTELMAYNRDDLAATALLVDRLRDICQPANLNGAWITKSDWDGESDLWGVDEYEDT
jgi:predicted RecB family nuclease